MEQEKQKQRWVPLEANPDVLNSFAAKIGTDIVSQGYGFQDMYGLDPDLLGMIPRPALAVILLYPLTEERERERLREIAELDGVRGTSGQLHGQGSSKTAVHKNVFYMKQTIGNACGTIALIHSLMNNLDVIRIDSDEPNVFLRDFLEATQGMDPDGVGEYLENGPCAQLLASIHADAAEGGDTAAPSVDEEINLHFVAFVEHGGGLWELDGRRAGPVYHGETGKNDLLENVARVVQTEYMSGADSLDFNMMALAALE